MNCFDTILTLREEGPICHLLGEPETASTPPLAQPIISEEEETLSAVYNLFFDAVCKPSVPPQVEQKVRAVLNYLSVTLQDHSYLKDLHRHFFGRVLQAKEVQNFVPIATPLTAQYLFETSCQHLNASKKNAILLQEVIDKVQLLDKSLSNDGFCKIFARVLESQDLKKIAQYLDEAFARHGPYPLSSWTYQFEGILYLGERLSAYSPNICKVSFVKEGEETLPLHIHRLFLHRIEYFKKQLEEVSEISLPVFSPLIARSIVEGEISDSKIREVCELPKKKEEKIEVIKQVMTTAAIFESDTINKKCWGLFVNHFEKLEKISGKSGHRVRFALSNENDVKFLRQKYVLGLARAVGKGDEEAIEYASRKKRFGKDFRLPLMREITDIDKDSVDDVLKFLDSFSDEEIESPEDAQTLFSLYYQIVTMTPPTKGENRFFALLKSYGIDFLVAKNKRFEFFYYLEKLLTSHRKYSNIGGEIADLLKREKTDIKNSKAITEISFPTLYALLNKKQPSQEDI